MKQKKIPMRSCAVTREKFPKQELLRVVKTPENEVKVDLTGRLNGRGVYLKKDLEVLEKAKKTKALSRALEIDISDEVYLSIEKVINEEAK